MASWVEAAESKQDAKALLTAVNSELSRLFCHSQMDWDLNHAFMRDSLEDASRASS